MVGEFTSISQAAGGRVALFRSDGKRDPVFRASLSSWATAASALPDGRLLVAGAFLEVNSTSAPSLAILREDGRLETSFSPGILFYGEIHCVAAIPMNKLFIAGRFTHIGKKAVSAPNIAVLQQDGGIDSSFHPSAGPNGEVYAVVRQPDGKLVLFGHFVYYGGIGRPTAVRINADGSLDPTFNSSPNLNHLSFGSTVSPVIMRGGRIAFATNTQHWGGTRVFGLVVLTAEGKLDPLFNTGSAFGEYSSSIHSLAAQADGKLVVGGSFSSFNGAAASNLLRLNVDGSLDSSFRATSEPDGPVRDVEIGPDGKMMVVGDFLHVGGVHREGVVRLLPDGEVDLRFSGVTAQVRGTHQVLRQEDERYLLYGPNPMLGNLQRTRYLGRLLANGAPDSSFGLGGELAYYPARPFVIQSDGTIVTVSEYGHLDFLVAARAPTISQQPVGSRAIAGADVELSVVASGVPQPTYQWYRDGVAVAGGTSSTLTLKKLQLTQSGRYSVAVINDLGTLRSSEAVVSVTLAAPKIQTISRSMTSSSGQSALLEVKVVSNASPDFQWYLNGVPIAGATSSSHMVSGVRASDVGAYSVRVSDAYGIVTSDVVQLALEIPGKLNGTMTEAGIDIAHPNGNVYDQMQLTGGAAAVRADAGQVVRTSFVDLSDDIVQVEFAGAGTLTITLENATGPARPANYNQAVNYMKGHARIVVAGADETTNLSVFSVGRMTAFDPSGAFDVSKPSGGTNDPARNGNPIFKSGVSYDGHADIASISILSANGKFGGLRTSNATYFATAGLTGVYAPGVTFTGPVFVGDISASDAAQPVLRLGAASDVRITGGDLTQANGAAVDISGIARLRFTAGQDSHGRALPAQANKAKLTENGVDVTSQIAAAPGL